MSGPYSIEVCAGAGGQALGLEQAGFEHLNLVEIDPWACATLRLNRPQWCVTEGDLAKFTASTYRGIDLYAGGLPCPPFSVAGKQLGENDERNLFPVALEQIEACRPKAVLIENVPGILDPAFETFRTRMTAQLERIGLGYRVEWRRFNAADFGVPQLRPRVTLVAIQRPFADRFAWPEPAAARRTVGEALGDLMAANGWSGAQAWAARANKVAPTVVGGSKKHGGPDLGPTRARRAWAELGVNGLSIAEDAPADEPSDAMPRLTVRMVARLQGFPDDWRFAGKKTNAYRQVGNAFPPPVAKAVARNIRTALGAAQRAAAE